MVQRAIDPVAVKAQLRRLLRQQQASGQPPWLHAEVARRMAERLALIRLKPRQMLEWWGSLGAGDEVLRQACPQAHRTVVEPDAAWAGHTRATRQPAWWTTRRWVQRAEQVQTAADALPDGEAQMVWANMVLHAEADPPALMARWEQALGVDGFVMFSCLGPDTLKQLRALYAQLGWPAPGADFVDMHDLGDMLVHAGFADPVMDQETLTLTWATPEALLAELRSLGGNTAPQRSPGLRTPRWRGRLLNQLEALRLPDGRLAMSFEVAYGHAFKAPPRRPKGTESQVSLDEMKTLLRASRQKVAGHLRAGLKSWASPERVFQHGL